MSATGVFACTLLGTLDANKYHPYAIQLLAVAHTVDGTFATEDRALMPFDKSFVDGNSTLKIDEGTAIEEESGKDGVVLLTSDKRVPYAVFVLATGFSWTDPLDVLYLDQSVRERIIARHSRRKGVHGHGSCCAYTSFKFPFELTSLRR